MKFKNIGVVFIAMIFSLSILTSCGINLSVSDFDWTLYTNTRWRSEEDDAELYFMEKSNGLAFDLYISQICILENAKTTGKLKSTKDGFADTADCKVNHISINAITVPPDKIDDVFVKTEIIFSPDGDSVTVTITEANGVAVSLGSYRFVKLDADTVTLKDVYGTFSNNIDELKIIITLHPNGVARMIFETDRQLNEDTIGTFIFKNNQITYKRLYATNRLGDPYDTTTPYQEGTDGSYGDVLPETTINIIDKDTLEVEENYFISGYRLFPQERTLSRVDNPL